MWLILASNLEEIKTLLDDSPYSLLTDLVVGVQSQSGYELYDVYNPCKIRGGALKISTLGTWHPGTGLKITLNDNKFRRRSNLQGMKIKAVAVVSILPRVFENCSNDQAKISYIRMIVSSLCICSDFCENRNCRLNSASFLFWKIG